MADVRLVEEFMAATCTLLEEEYPPAVRSSPVSEKSENIHVFIGMYMIKPETLTRLPSHKYVDISWLKVDIYGSGGALPSGVVLSLDLG